MPTTRPSQASRETARMIVDSWVTDHPYGSSATAEIATDIQEDKADLVEALYELAWAQGPEEWVAAHEKARAALTRHTPSEEDEDA